MQLIHMHICQDEGVSGSIFYVESRYDSNIIVLEPPIMVIDRPFSIQPCKRWSFWHMTCLLENRTADSFCGSSGKTQS